MSIEFRQRTPAEYASILWKRKWLIILPTIAVSFAVAIVVWRLPNVYQSSTLLTVRPSNLGNIVPQLSDDDLTIRINNIGQEVVSRTSLEPLIVGFNLYAAERQRGEPMELLVERMRTRDVAVEVNRSRNDVTNGFYLSFKGPDPTTTQKITAELASKYVNAQNKAASEGANQTAMFVDDQLKQAKALLDDIDKQRLAYMQQHLSSLPTTSNSLVSQLTGLYEQQKTLTTEIGRLRDQQTLLTTQLGDINKQRQGEIDDVAQSTTDPKTTMAWAQLSARESQLDSELHNMLTTLREKNPDVIAKKQEIASVKRDKQQMLDEQKGQIEDKRKRLAEHSDPRILTINANLLFTRNELARQQKLLDQTNSQIAELGQRVNGIPVTEVGLGTLDREYQTRKATYDELLEKKRKADIGAAATNQAQGETIQVIDPANLPAKPVAPKRPLLMSLGLGLGLFAGLLFAAAFEVPRLLTVQNIEDARHYTNLPVLVSVPELLTPREQRALRLRRTMLAAASVVATLISIPALALFLRLTHILERFTS